MNYFLFILFIFLGMAGSVAARKLTATAALAGGVLASVIFLGFGWIAVVLMTVFFLAASLATSWKGKLKQEMGLSQDSRSGRSTAQVLANGGVAAMLGLLAVLWPQHKQLFLLMVAAAFSSSTADTVSSELGSVYGSKFYDVLNFKAGIRGRDGIVSLEGILFGIIGSCLVAATYASSEGWNMRFAEIVLAGTIGNLADSYLGATLERKNRIGNNGVNFFNTLIAALFIMLL